MKTCFKCGIDKPSNKFYKHPKMADGYLGKCKECTKLDVAAAYQRSGGRKEYERKRNKTVERKKKRREYWRASYLRCPKKYHARAAVARALRSGRIKKYPCVACNETKVEAHHWDYSKPLDVLWYCHKHHCEIEGRIAR